MVEMRMTKSLVAILFFCSVACAVPQKNNNNVVVIVDKSLNFINIVYSRDAIPCISIQGNYLETKKDNIEFARIYFCFFNKTKSILKKRKFVAKNWILIKAEELWREKNINEVVKYFPSSSGLREKVKVFVIFKEDWLNKKEVKLYPVKFGINEVQYCST